MHNDTHATQCSGPQTSKNVQPNFSHSAEPWWFASVSAYSHGAVLIQDGRGEIIGWATDAAGHTTEETAPDRRNPRQTYANAVLFAMAPQMLKVCRLLAQDDGPIDMDRVLQAQRLATGLMRLMGDPIQPEAWGYRAPVDSIAGAAELRESANG